MAFADGLARWVWEHRYQWREDGVPREADIAATWQRVARAVAAAEGAAAATWAPRFEWLLDDFAFLPGGRILAGAGTGRRVTLCNCFVMGELEDSIAGIFRALEESALTLQHGGGIGCDFSTLRPRGSPATASGNVASGPVSFMRLWNSMCATVLESGGRRGAMMATLRCDHPDILEFIDAKRDPAALRYFNLSVLVGDDLLAAVRAGRGWPLVFPLAPGEQVAAGTALVARRWSGSDCERPCRVVAEPPAREIWQRLVAAAHAVAEPGVLFVDTINRENNLAARERLTATNPCGELPLPPYGACTLGSLNLARFVRGAFTPGATLDLAGLGSRAKLAVRFLDDVLDVTRFPLPQQAAQARATRRIGLGVTGLADALIMLGLRYDSAAARDCAAGLMRAVTESAYAASAELAAEKGPFPGFERESFLAAPGLRRLPGPLRDRIAAVGVRNSHLTAIAPAGSISLLAGNVSSGVEPVFEFTGRRRLLDRDGRATDAETTDCAWRQWRERGAAGRPPPAFVTATAIDPEAQLAMQAALQPHVDSAISKTLCLPADYPAAAYPRLLELAHSLGLKGCTTYRPGTSRGGVVRLGEGAAVPEATPVERCCPAP